MNRIYCSFVCHQNNTRTNEFFTYRNKFIISLINKFKEEGLLKIEKEEGYKLYLSKIKNYRIIKIRSTHPISYLQCLALIRRKTDTSGNKQLIFSTSQGLLTIDQITDKKIGGVPLLKIEYLS